MRNYAATAAPLHLDHYERCRDSASRTPFSRDSSRGTSRPDEGALHRWLHFWRSGSATNDREGPQIAGFPSSSAITKIQSPRATHLADRRFRLGTPTATLTDTAKAAPPPRACSSPAAPIRRPPSTVGQELLSSKHKSGGLATTGTLPLQAWSSHLHARACASTGSVRNAAAASRLSSSTSGPGAARRSARGKAQANVASHTGPAPGKSRVTAGLAPWKGSGPSRPKVISDEPAANAGRVSHTPLGSKTVTNRCRFHVAPRSQKSRFAALLKRERRDSNPRPPA